MLWKISAVVLFVWLVLKFVLHKGGYVHILLILGLTFLVVQIIAYRKTQYHASSSDGNGSVKSSR